MAEWKEVSKTATLGKGDQVIYAKSDFGYYVKMQKVHISISKKEKTSVAPFGARRNQVMVGLWNPNTLASGGPNEANVYIPKNKILRVRKEIK